MNIGIFGGTFDPIHIGHLIIAEQASQSVGLDEVWFIPAASPPHKPGQDITPAEHRVEMVRLAICDHPKFRLSTVELLRPGPSYTVDTVRQLCSQHPHDRFFLIVGGDMVNDLPNWYKIEEILQMVDIIGHARPGTNTDALPPEIAEKVIWVQDPVTVNVSSTQIRRQLARGASGRYLLPEPVRKYIKGKRLYGT
ncbi:putative nicotinate-nucleotide adenylyltransferase [Polycladomyces abyssicola]|uniref:Probable nicotinate-nucleotide adenylyltransferase n=1 Tax=Polycladomyces abyssicola TaxID=1125966 RepID=A0A8D5ZNZ3_9BACL|nr:nicotinate-nucleotide adenylyltransferase [Polycladomyces abyssicola]BCU82472.1 putative nicotinate-nucleotide adenylyltransferase [Polycladomyces abyssicola]